MTQVQQGVTTVSITAVGALLYWVCAMFKHHDCNPNRLAIFAFNIVGTITGVFIFFGSFDVMTTSAQNGVWSGVAGVIITLATAQQVIREFGALFEKQVNPTHSAERSDVNEPVERRK
jgi:hypothetical protein